jgi:hypothetical protein
MLGPAIYRELSLPDDPELVFFLGARGCSRSPGMQPTRPDGR